MRAGISTSVSPATLEPAIDRHSGHLARDGREHAIRFLEELSAGQRPRWTLVDAASTQKPAAPAGRDNTTMS